MVVRALPVHRLGGLEWHTADLAHGLMDLGHAVTVFTSACPGEPLMDAGEFRFPVVYLEGGRSGDYGLSFFLKMSRLVEEHDRSRGFDIIHCQEFAALAFTRFRGRLVVTVHGTMTSETPLHAQYRRQVSLAESGRNLWRYKSRAALQIPFNWMVGRADRLVCDSEFTFRELMHIDGRLRLKTSVIPLGIDWSRYDLPRTNEADRHSSPLRLITLGRLQESKGLGIVLQAMLHLKGWGISVMLDVGGSGPYLERAELFVRRHDLEEMVRFRGRIAPHGVSDFLTSGDVFIFSDLTQPAFGLVAAEARAHGLAVIAARSGAIPEVVTRVDGWIYSPWDALELAGLIRNLCEDSTSWQSIVDGEETLRRYDHTRMALATAEVYRGLSG